MSLHCSPGVSPGKRFGSIAPDPNLKGTAMKLRGCLTFCLLAAAVPFQGEQEAGYHEVKFDATGLSSGVYYCRLTAGGFLETRRMLLIR